MRNHGHLLKKITATGLAFLLLAAGLPHTAAAAAAESCKDWNKKKFFKSATVEEVRACLSDGEDPNEPDTQGYTALHRAARDTADPAVIEALLEAGASPGVYSAAGRLPWFYARKNKKIKGSDAYQRLRLTLAKKPDWSRVQAVQPNTMTAVRLYRDVAPSEIWKVKGRFESATANSITLRLKDGRTQTLPKTAVRKVLTVRPFAKRWLGWVALGATFLLLEAPGDLDRRSHLVITLPIAAVFFNVSGKKGVYNVPPEHRILPQGDKQSGAQDNDSGKPEEPLRD
ncbi:MAG: ankyrin repeat domain-containing protein [Bryobacterales bacterium]|nr:ankyrin repeat domain-containing protein [Bryobacterales bacterium]